MRARRVEGGKGRDGTGGWAEGRGKEGWDGKAKAKTFPSLSRAEKSETRGKKRRSSLAALKREEEQGRDGRREVSVGVSVRWWSLGGLD